MTPFEDVVAQHILHLEPRFLGNYLSLGVKTHLNKLLLKYSNHLQGVPLLYTHFDYTTDTNANANSNTTSTTSAPILFDNPRVHLPVKVHWTVFAPRPGAYLTGIVNAISGEHLGVLVLNYFSCLIYSSQMTAAAQWIDNDGNIDDDEDGYMGGRWILKATGAGIQVGSQVTFQVLQVSNQGEILTILGSLDRTLQTSISSNVDTKSIMDNVILSSPTQGKKKKQQHQQKANN